MSDVVFGVLAGCVMAAALAGCTGAPAGSNEPPPDTPTTTDNDRTTGVAEEGAFSVDQNNDAGPPSGDTAAPLVGWWHGRIELPQGGLWTVFRFEPDADGEGPAGYLDSPDQKARDIPIESVDQDGSEVTITSSAVGAVYRAQREGDRLIGRWNQRGQELPLTIERVVFPAYLDQRLVDEYPVSIGDPSAPLPGVFTIPTSAGDGAIPVVVLVPGSGPQDRDVMIGPNRPFRDLAWGLAARGIATIRYDKRTLAYPASVSLPADEDSPYFRVEYIDDALSALAVAGEAPGNGGPIFLLGHSAGGTLAPAIAEEAAARGAPPAGVIMVAAAERRLAQVSLDQNRQLLNQDPDNSQLRDAVLQAVAVFESILEHAIPEEEEIQPGLPVAYYYASDRYRPLEAIARLDTPILIAQGEVDFQVTVADDFDAFHSALGERPDTAFRLFPGVNHLLIRTDDPTASVAQYQEPGFVEEEVIAAIADWVLGWSDGAGHSD